MPLRKADVIETDGSENRLALFWQEGHSFLCVLIGKAQHWDANNVVIANAVAAMDFDWSLDLFISFFVVDNDDFAESRKFSVWIEIQDQSK